MTALKASVPVELKPFQDEARDAMNRYIDEAIAHAVAGERQRCAVIAESHGKTWGESNHGGPRSTEPGIEIAKAIRGDAP